MSVTYANGETSTYGSDQAGSRIAVELADKSLELELMRDPEMVLGEAFAEGRLRVISGTIYGLLELLFLNTRSDAGGQRLLEVLELAQRTKERVVKSNTKRRSRQNVAFHYDLSPALYDLFLDPERQYSCAYFESPTMTLEAAQVAKMRHLASKLALEPRQKVLDIGSGWGGLGIYLARSAGVDVTGVTLSTEQHAESNARAKRQGLEQHVRFELQDYRNVSARYDRIVSVGMLEHVGKDQFDTYFAKVAQVLEEDGVAVIHAIGQFDVPSPTNPWIEKYIFPGGYIPSLSEIVQSVERAGLMTTDIEVLRLHYAQTLRVWRKRFLARRHDAIQLYDERFTRLWEFYLAASEIGFRYRGLMVFQIQLAKRVDSLPIVRTYMTEREEEIRCADESRENRGEIRAAE
ncbi:SAM-dependent methyltransferase [Pseudochelatococcus contaminans]|uniref:SAM-dependent methyltransferase n=1 Tax=Pseudochelatococcus contaminans TaxID=1538103 RepID=UPI001FEC45E0|nr:cyclopropane-fatty-acyl-phospholipid synthase family protein [Pseudochelatococcus contaminans]